MSSVVAILRTLTPYRPLTYEDALRVAERQAVHLLELAGIAEPPVPDGVVTALPRLQVERLARIPVSGSTHWTKGKWLIVLNSTEPEGRVRYSMFHEFKHILDNPFIDKLYPATAGMSAHARAEQICDYFAACALMPRMWVKRAWGNGVQELADLSRRFGVSQTAMRVRLQSIGLMQAPARCRGPNWLKTKRPTYYGRPRSVVRKES